MKRFHSKLLLVSLLVIHLAAPLLRAGETLIVGQASRPDDERSIRELENQNAVAVLHLDYAALERLWSERLVVTTPGNFITPNRAADFKLFRDAKGPLYTSYQKSIECIIFDGDVTIVMGVETVGPRATPGKTVFRRYTNVWKFDHDTWRLIARQATMVPDRGALGAPSSRAAAKP